MPRSVLHSAIVFDLEYTAWEGSMARGWNAPGEFREVVQIGAVRLDPHTLEEVASLNLLVRPRLNPRPSAYLENLTGITNACLAAEGVDFAQAYVRFAEFARGGVMAAYGRDDLVLTENLRLYGLTGLASLPRHINVVPWLRDQGIAVSGHNACHVGPLCGASFEGHAHDALDDARSVAAGIRALLARGANNPFLS
jgi:inhibitor of KinA sporulation pathway (predicted exonuclease)